MILSQQSTRARFQGAARLPVLLCVAAFALPGAATAQVAAPEPAPPLAPDFTLRALDGPNVRLHELRGRVVLLNFWTSGCVPCRELAPHLQQLHERHGADGLELLGIAVDGDTARAAQAARRQAPRHPVLFDADQQVARAYALDTLPTVHVVDRDGRLRLMLRGFRAGDMDVLAARVRTLLKE